MQLQGVQALCCMVDGGKRIGSGNLALLFNYRATGRCNIHFLGSVGRAAFHADVRQALGAAFHTGVRQVLNLALQESSHLRVLLPNWLTGDGFDRLKHRNQDSHGNTRHQYQIQRFHGRALSKTFGDIQNRRAIKPGIAIPAWNSSRHLKTLGAPSNSLDHFRLWALMPTSGDSEH